MFAKPSLFTRIAVGKLVGFGIGLIGLLVLPYFWPDANWMLRLGVLFWYALVGAFIGVIGVYHHHPVLHFPMPWWVRSSLVGGWMNFVLVLIAYDTFETMFASAFTPNSILASPWWLVLEGIIVGLFIGGLATRLGGDGPETVTADARRMDANP